MQKRWSEGVVLGSEGLWLRRALDRMERRRDQLRGVTRIPSQHPTWLWVVPDVRVLRTVLASCELFAGRRARILSIPAWDVLPYDSASPSADILAQRSSALVELYHPSREVVSSSRESLAPRPTVVLTTVRATLQYVPAMLPAGLQVMIGAVIPKGPLGLWEWLSEHGYRRESVVRQCGQMALRGGLVDVFAAGYERPLRVDFMGDMVETIRWFDPETQLSQDVVALEVRLVQASEVLMRAGDAERFAHAYLSEFGGTARKDPLYVALSEGLSYPGFEHWWPLWREEEQRLTLMDAVLRRDPGARLLFSGDVESARSERIEHITNAYEARKERLSDRGGGGSGGGRAKIDGLPATIYRPVPLERMYLTNDLWQEKMASFDVCDVLSPYIGERREEVDQVLGARVSLGYRQRRSKRSVDDGKRVPNKVPNNVANNLNGLNGLDANENGDETEEIGFLNPLTALMDDIERQVARGEGETILAVTVDSAWKQITRALDTRKIPYGTIHYWRDDANVERMDTKIWLTKISSLASFDHPDVRVVTEDDILGQHVQTRSVKRKKSSSVVHLQSLHPGDLVVHVDYGVGRFERMQTIDVAMVKVDCLCLRYAGNDTVFLPAINVDVLSRYGADADDAVLDKLGSVNWQQRKGRVKGKITELADALIALEAQRKTLFSAPMLPLAGMFEEFCLRFPYVETDDQMTAIAEVIEDLARPYPMDRLVCGDAGVGKTEIAIRAAFVAAMSGRQVAMIAPTTLLVQQHLSNIRGRFDGFPVQVDGLSRMTPPKRAKEVRERLARGTLDVVIGTHALLATRIDFARLGLIIIDEEQHFGVGQKEKLKERFPQVPVLTLTATPIPRTLHMALSGVRSLSVVATPPVDRLAVQTFTQTFDEHIVQQAIRREMLREGQTFVVCPMIADLGPLTDKLKELIPTARITTVHGQMSTSDLETQVGEFVAGNQDVMICTPIIESGIDIPKANTIVVYKATHFGLAQLYQLRGRVGRSSRQAYCYFMTEPGIVLTSFAQRRLSVMQSLDSLGAGFQVASHDLDIRGAGNLLGAEQSGQIREVGVELYQSMLAREIERRREALESHRIRQQSQQSQQSLDVSVGREREVSGGAPQEKEKIRQDVAQKGHEGYEGYEGMLKDQLAGFDPVSTNIQVGLSAFIPEEYVPDLNPRLEIYQRLAAPDINPQEIWAMEKELADRFGEVPAPVKRLLLVAALKRRAAKLAITAITTVERSFKLTIDGARLHNTGLLMERIQKDSMPTRFVNDTLIVSPVGDSKTERVKDLLAFLERLTRKQGSKQAQP